MRHFLLYFILGCCFLSACNKEDCCTDATTRLISKSTTIRYRGFSTGKSITYYQGEKPQIDSVFYIYDDSPDLFLGKTQWLYNEEGLVEKIIRSNPNQVNDFITDILYDTSQRISFISKSDSDYSELFTYNDLSISKNRQNPQGNTIFTTYYELDENNHVMSALGSTGTQAVTVEYLNNDIFKFNRTQESIQTFHYLDTSTVPLFMKHPEFGEHLANYILFQSGLYVSSHLNTGQRFLSSVTSEYAGTASDYLSYTYEFNDDLLPIYIRKNYISSDSFDEWYYEYE